MQTIVDKAADYIMLLGFCEEHGREQPNIRQKRQPHLLRVVLVQAKAHDSSVFIME